MLIKTYLSDPDPDPEPEWPDAADPRDPDLLLEAEPAPLLFDSCSLLFDSLSEPSFLSEPDSEPAFLSDSELESSELSCQNQHYFL